jgi:hypothetical protein
VVSTGEGESNDAAALTLSPDQAAAAGKRKDGKEPGSSTQINGTLLAGYWKATGRKADDDGKGEKETEYLKLEVNSTGHIAGMVDVNGDGVYNEEDCQIDNAVFDPDTGAFSFEQIWPPADDDPDDDGETIYWSAVFDRDKDRLVDGKWRDADGNLTGTFSAKRDANAGETDGDARRVDPRDGGAYTKQEFVEHYGGEDEWHESEPSTPLTKDDPPPKAKKKKKDKKKTKKKSL